MHSLFVPPCHFAHSKLARFSSIHFISGENRIIQLLPVIYISRWIYPLVCEAVSEVRVKFLKSLPVILLLSKFQATSLSRTSIMEPPLYIFRSYIGSKSKNSIFGARVQGKWLAWNIRRDLDSPASKLNTRQIIYISGVK
jgi:hypothetical protein